MNGEEVGNGCHERLREGGHGGQEGQEGPAVGVLMMTYSAVLNHVKQPHDWPRKRQPVQQDTCKSEAGDGKPLM
jgi:hypothetical protein